MVNTEHSIAIRSIHVLGFLQAHCKIGGALTPGVLAVQTDTTQAGRHAAALLALLFLAR